MEIKMSIYNEPEFQKLLKKVKWRRIRGTLRCIYSWALILGPLLLMRQVSEQVDTLSNGILWCYLISIPVLLVLGVVLWCKGFNDAFFPIHKPLIRFNKKPSEEGLRMVCATMVSLPKNKKYQKLDYDEMRRAHSVAVHNTAVISRELAEFYTTILKTCNVAGI